MSKGKTLGVCKTCQNEIVDLVNEGVFGDGECEHCERHRYESQSMLLDALAIIRKLTELEYEAGNDWSRMDAMEEALNKIRSWASSAIYRANGTDF